MYNSLSINTWNTSNLQPFNLSNTSKLKGTSGCNTGHNDTSCRDYTESDINEINSDNCPLTNGKYVCSGTNQRGIPFSDIQKCVCNNNGICNKNGTCKCDSDTATTRYDESASCKAYPIPQPEKHYYNMTSIGGTGGCASESSLIQDHGSIDPKIWKEYTTLQDCINDKENQKYQGTSCTSNGGNPDYVYHRKCVGNDPNSCEYGKKQDACVVAKLCNELPWPAPTEANKCPEGMYFTGQWNGWALDGPWLGCTPYKEQACKFCVPNQDGQHQGDCICPYKCSKTNCCGV